MSAADDVTLNDGGEVASLISAIGVDDWYFARTVLLANEVSVAAVARGELAENQSTAAVLINFGGRLNNQKGMEAITVVIEPEVAKALWRALRSKYIEIPIDQRT